MNWEGVKYIYCRVLIYNNNIEYLGGDRYKLISYYSSGKKYYEAEYQNEVPHGKCIYWDKNGQKYLEQEWKDGNQIK